MTSGYVFGNKVVKQGNSLCVRIPSYIAKQAKIKPGRNISIILETNQEFDEGYSAELFMRISKNTKKTNKFGEDKIRMFIVLHLRYLKKALDRDEQFKRSYWKKARKEYSDKFIEEYFEWCKLIQEAYIYSNDGSFSVKPEYLKN